MLIHLTCSTLDEAAHEIQKAQIQSVSAKKEALSLSWHMPNRMAIRILLEVI
jgi:hypothetical protein